MRLLNRIKISTKVFTGFAIVLLLLLLISTISLLSLIGAAQNLMNYRALARQTNAEGRVQANMLMTRLHAKDFIINANEDNIEKIEERARRTISLIAEARELTTNTGYQLIIDSVDRELDDYVTEFGRVTKLQVRRDEIVHDSLNVVGPQIERNLTAIMKSAFDDGDAEAAYWAGITLRNLMLARLYANRFLIQNDDASYRRVLVEFIEMEKSIDELFARLENPERIERATEVRDEQRVYARSFEDVHSVITSRNDIIRNQLDKIGPKVADTIEQLKLAIRAEQDDLGPRAEEATGRAVVLTLVISVASILIAGLAAWVIGFGVSRPIRKMAIGMRELADGNLDADVSVSDRQDEVKEMADAVQVFRRSMVQVRELADQQRHAAEEVRKARDAAEQANRAKSAFLANMSHELRTPMNAILGYSEMLKEDAEDAGRDEEVADLEKIHQAGSHLLALINDVLDLAKVESGKMEALAEDFNLAGLIDEVRATAEPLVGKNENRLVVTLGDSLGIVHQDMTKLRQALLNLLSNAAKFTKGGTVTLAAERRVESGAAWLILAVRDNGIGIAEDNLDRVFEEFGQADDTTSREYGGTGLGLPLSRQFSQLLGGDLTVESKLGSGSVFTIKVPAVLPGTASKEATPKPKTDAELEELKLAGSGRTILVIDDDAEARNIVERLLRQDGFEVVAAATGEEGLRLAHALEPSIITLDVIMPDMDGWTVLRALKADPGLRDIPVVMLTMLDDHSRGYSLGATDYIVKPVDREQLRTIVARHLTPDVGSIALLVDDEPVVRDSVAETLREVGWQIDEAGNGREALDRLGSVRPSLILLDLMMPVMDGFDFLVELHADPDWRKIPVIVLTSKDLTAEDKRVLSGRVEQIIEKDSWSHDQLLDLVRKLAGERGPRPT